MSDNIAVTVQIASQDAPPGPGKWAPLALGFRPFFLLGIWFAVLLMLVSLGGFAADIKAPNYFDLPLWHAHEMIFGYASAVIAGFLLTSVRNWTHLPTPSGTPLAWLALLWLTPRLLSFITILPPEVFALLDLLFLPLLAIILGRLLVQARQPHNYPIPLLLLLLGLCNAAVHLEVLGLLRDASAQAMQIAVMTIIALIAVVAGRVLPFFMQRGINARPDSYQAIEAMALPSILLFAGSIALGQAWLSITTAMLASVVHGIRLGGWFDRQILREPMLWVLHAAYGWLVAGFLLYALSIAMHSPVVQAIHAWTLGAIGMFTLGMMARVALGHTGRNIEAPPWIPAAFTLIFLASLIRVMFPLFNPGLLEVAVISSAALWMLAFSMTGLRYTFILLHARVDGTAG